MPSIDEIMNKRAEKMAERPQFDGTDLQLRDDKTSQSVAMAVGYSLYSGQEGDPYLEYYIAHAYPAIGKKGGQYTRTVYCPVESGHDGNYDCQGCREGAPKKDRFAMWLYVEKILYNTLVGEEKYPPEPWIDGNRYFTQPVGRVQYWDTSAWKESPLADIHMLAKQLTDLRSTKIAIKAVNTGMDKRYKFFPERVGALVPMDAKLYEESIAQIKPVQQVLMESLASVPTVQAPPPDNVTQLPQKPDELPFSGPVTTPVTDPAPPGLPPFKAPSKPERLF